MDTQRKARITCRDNQLGQGDSITALHGFNVTRCKKPTILDPLVGYGITVEVSHTVATVYMKVKTEELRERALDLARQTERITEVIDNIDVDPTIEEAPFEW